MKGIINLYTGICLLALALKYIIKFVQTLAGKKLKEHNHEQEHNIADVIKFIIIIIIGLFFIFISKK